MKPETEPTKSCDTCRSQEECLNSGILDICESYSPESKQERLDRIRDSLTFCRKQIAALKRQELNLLLELSAATGRKPVIEYVNASDVKVTRVATPGTRTKKLVVGGLEDMLDKLKGL